jgi:hypothetical protein
MLHSTHLTGVASVLGIAVLGSATIAIASPGSGTSSTTLVTANFDEEIHLNSDRVKLQTKDANDIRVQQMTFAAGAFSGWHHHPGIIIVSVASGSVTLSHSDCSSKTYGPASSNGAVFVEGGDDPIQASSAGGATVYVTAVTPDGQQVRIEDDVPPCAAAPAIRVPPRQ